VPELAGATVVVLFSVVAVVVVTPPAGVKLPVKVVLEPVKLPPLIVPLG
jgi:hypothetical protein